MSEWRQDWVYVAGDGEGNELQVCLSTVVDTAAMPTGPDAGKGKLVRGEKREKTKGEKHKKYKLKDT